MAAGVALSGALGNGAGAAHPSQALEPNALVINPVPGFELSPYLYMQFMEPLGATDGSVEAAWDHLAEQWRDDVVAVTKELGTADDAMGRDLRGFLSLARGRRST